MLKVGNKYGQIWLITKSKVATISVKVKPAFEPRGPSG